MDRDVRVKHAAMCKFLLVTSSVFTALSAFTHYGEHARMLFIPFAYVTTLAYLLSVVMSIFMLAFIVAPRCDLSTYYTHDEARNLHLTKGAYYICSAFCEVGTLLLLYFYPSVFLVAVFLAGLAFFTYQAFMLDIRVAAKVDNYSDW